MLPRDTILGPLKVLEVYEQYDGPRLFSAENAAGHRFLCVWLGSEGTTERWLYVPVSFARLRQLRLGTVTLRSGFAEPEGGTAMVVEINRATHVATVRHVPASRLAEEQLPAEGELLSEEPLPDDPRFSSRELLDVALEFPDRRSTEAPLTVVGSLLHNLQKTIDAIGQALEENLSGFGPVPRALQLRTQLALAEVFESSFGMRLASTADPELFDDSLVARSVGEFLALVQSGADEDALRQQLRRLHRRAAIRYGALLNYIAASGADVKVEWRAGRSATRKRARLSCDDAAKAVAIIRRHEEQEPLIHRVTGILTGAVIPSRTFRFEIPAESRVYTGTISEEAMPSTEHAKLSERYLAKIREIPEVSAVTDEITSRYELLALGQPRSKKP